MFLLLLWVCVSLSAIKPLGWEGQQPVTAPEAGAVCSLAAVGLGKLNGCSQSDAEACRGMAWPFRSMCSALEAGAAAAGSDGEVGSRSWSCSLFCMGGNGARKVNV